jgi:hypothetical protein
VIRVYSLGLYLETVDALSLLGFYTRAKIVELDLLEIVDATVPCEAFS